MACLLASPTRSFPRSKVSTTAGMRGASVTAPFARQCARNEQVPEPSSGLIGTPGHRPPHRLTDVGAARCCVDATREVRKAAVLQAELDARRGLPRGADTGVQDTAGRDRRRSGRGRDRGQARRRRSSGASADPRSPSRHHLVPPLGRSHRGVDRSETGAKFPGPLSPREVTRRRESKTTATPVSLGRGTRTRRRCRSVDKRRSRRTPHAGHLMRVPPLCDPLNSRSYILCRSNDEKCCDFQQFCSDSGPLRLGRGAQEKRSLERMKIAD